MTTDENEYEATWTKIQRMTDDNPGGITTTETGVPVSDLAVGDQVHNGVRYLDVTSVQHQGGSVDVRYAQFPSTSYRYELTTTLTVRRNDR
jgi:hypothetical protein